MGSKKKRSDIQDVFAIPLIVSQQMVPELESAKAKKVIVEPTPLPLETVSSGISEPVESVEIKEE